MQNTASRSSRAVAATRRNGAAFGDLLGTARLEAKRSALAFQDAGRHLIGQVLIFGDGMLKGVEMFSRLARRLEWPGAEIRQ